MSTFFSCPSPSFLTLTLQPGRASKAATAKVRTRCELVSVRLGMRILSFLCGLTLNAGASLGDIGNADRQVAANCDLTEKSLDRADLGNAGVGEGAEIIL